jgi:hypothetical protein
VYEYILWYLGVSDFAASAAGSIILYIVYMFRDIIMMVLEIVFNIASMYYLKAYFDKKTTLVGRSHASGGARVATTVAVEAPSILTKHDATAATKTETKSSTGVSSKKVEMRMSIMVICMCTLSVVEHILLITCITYPLSNPGNPLIFTLLYFGGFSIVFKHSLNFVLFYAFNKNFKKIFLRYLRLN